MIKICRVCEKPLEKFPYAKSYRKVGYCRDHCPENIIPKEKEKSRCLGTTKKGVQCKHWAWPEYSGYCKQHRKQASEHPTIVAKQVNDRTKRESKKKSRTNYKEYITGKEWQKKSKSVKNDYNSRCRLCNRKVILHGHHRTYERLGNETPEDITPLCVDCHNMFSWHYKYNSKLNIFEPKKDMTKYDVWKK